MIAMNGQPSGHPAQEQNSKGDKGGYIQQGVVAVQQTILWITRNDEKLKRREKNLRLFNVLRKADSISFYKK
jgi:hypothetical protein